MFTWTANKRKTTMLRKLSMSMQPKKKRAALNPDIVADLSSILLELLGAVETSCPGFPSVVNDLCIRAIATSGMFDLPVAICELIGDFGIATFKVLPLSCRLGRGKSGVVVRERF